MLLVEPGLEDSELIGGLIEAAEAYLRRRAKVLYAGSRFPLNPFYWGISGGSEGAGLLSGHHPFQRGVLDRGYAPSARRCSWRRTSARPSRAIPAAASIRRQTHLEIEEDAPPAHWWQGLAFGELPVSERRLVSRADHTELAHAAFWDMRWFGREDGRRASA